MLAVRCFWCKYVVTGHIYSYLHLFHHLFPKRADFSGGGDDHIFRALILTGYAVEEAAVVLEVDAQIRLQNTTHTHQNKYTPVENTDASYTNIVICTIEMNTYYIHALQ